MVREGTRSQTGHSKPRVFAQVDTEPTIKRTTKPKTAVVKKVEPTKPEAKGAKPTGVTKKTAAKKGTGAAKKVCRSVFGL